MATLQPRNIADHGPQTSPWAAAAPRQSAAALALSHQQAGGSHRAGDADALPLAEVQVEEAAHDKLPRVRARHGAALACAPRAETQLVSVPQLFTPTQQQTPLSVFLCGRCWCCEPFLPCYLAGVGACSRHLQQAVWEIVREGTHVLPCTLEP